MNDIPALTGPRFGPVSGGAPKRMVILLHGYGANGDDLIGLAPAFAQVLPDAVFVAPNAPWRCEMSPMGYQWFDVWDQNTADRLRQLRETAEIADAFIDAALEEHGLADKDLVLCGFSQGTMLSLHVGLRRPRPCAGILGYSGRLEAPETLAGEIVSRPPAMLIHGEQDELLAVALMDAAAARLRECGVKVETHRCPGLGHGIDPDGIRLGAGFLSVCFA
ncbi:MAG: phospholipase [Alphaproteobacteria bacterium]|nr:phospholipase [Alphaproteobacteria bacterium]